LTVLLERSYSLEDSNLGYLEPDTSLKIQGGPKK